MSRDSFAFLWYICSLTLLGFFCSLALHMKVIKINTVVRIRKEDGGSLQVSFCFKKYTLASTLKVAPPFLLHAVPSRA